MTNSSNVGIDRIHFYVPSYHMSLTSLATLRGHKETFFTRGIGQERMAIIPPDEDIVTMAANAAYPITQEHPDIDMLIFATESGFDLSKAAGIYVHRLLKLQSQCRVFETKQACYGATAGMQMALNHVRCNPESKVLIIASDVAKYAINTPAEASQGAGAIAMLVASNPRLLNINPTSGYVTEDHMDFWRPPYLPHALVNGRLSCDLYFQLLEKSWQSYSNKTGWKYEDHDFFCFHTPVPKLAEKAHKWLARNNGLRLSLDQVMQESSTCLHYNKLIGNTYTASLYIAIASLLENHKDNLANKRIGLYSYGSGCMAEYFSGEVPENYHNALDSLRHHTLLETSAAISAEQYHAWIQHQHPSNGEKFIPESFSKGSFRINHIENHIRHYETNLVKESSVNSKVEIPAYAG